MAPAFKKSIKFNHFIINYWRIGFLKMDNAISLQQKSPSHRFLTNFFLFAMKIINHHDKQLTPSESTDQEGFLSLGLGYHHIQFIGLEFFTTLWPPNQGEHLDRLIYHPLSFFTVKLGISKYYQEYLPLGHNFISVSFFSCKTGIFA